MKALVKTAYGEGNCQMMDWEEESSLNPTEVLVRIEWVGICGTDLAVFKSKVQYIVPIVMGHEFSGVVEEVGDTVTGFAPGDRVVGETSINTCGVCENCKRGYYNVCLKRKGLGRTANGVFRERIILDYKLLHKIPENVPTQIAVLCEPFASCHHAVVERAKVQSDESVLVFGPGLIGFLVALLSFNQGAKVTVLGLPADTKRLEICKEIGSNVEVIKLDGEGDFSKVLQTKFFGKDVVFECSGNPNAATWGMDIVKPRGRYVQMGLPGEYVEIDLSKIASRELTILGSYSSIHSDFEAVLSLMKENIFDFSRLISLVFPLENWEEAFHNAQKGDFMKIVMKVTKKI